MKVKIYINFVKYVKCLKLVLYKLHQVKVMKQLINIKFNLIIIFCSSGQSQTRPPGGYSTKAESAGMPQQTTTTSKTNIFLLFT